MSKIAIIGAGFSGLNAASYLSAGGHEVHVFEKNSEAGGRARQLKTTKSIISFIPGNLQCPVRVFLRPSFPEK